MFERVVANVGVAAFLIWAADASIKAGAPEELTRQMVEEELRPVTGSGRRGTGPRGCTR